MNKTILCIALAAVPLGGCATKHFGRVASISASERETMSCGEIDAERLKIDRFDDQVRQKSRVNGASVLAFIGDFGVGNALRKHSAVASAAKRREQLRQVSLERGCPVAPASASTVVAMR